MDEASKSYFGNLMKYIKTWCSRDNGEYILGLPGSPYNNYEIVPTEENGIYNLYKHHQTKDGRTTIRDLLYTGTKEDCALKASDDFLASN